jgi:hypothetical protein
MNVRTEAESFAILDQILAAANADEADAAFVFVDQNITRFANSQLHQNMSEESSASGSRASTTSTACSSRRARS